MSSEGRVHRLVLKMVTTDESGDVAFVVGEEKSVASLLVEEKPKGKKKLRDGVFYAPHASLSTVWQIEVWSDTVCSLFKKECY